MRILRGLLLSALSSVAIAEERFYTIMGPDGQLQVIRAPEASDRPGGEEPGKPVASGAANGAATDKPQEAATPEVVGAAPADQPAAVGEVTGFAPYDSDAYAEVEAVDQALEQEKEKDSKRFYLIDDGVGIRVSEAGVEGTGSEAGSAVAAPPQQPARAYRGIASAYEELPAAAAVAAFPGLRECVAGARREELRELVPGEPVGLLLNQQAYRFLDGSGAVEVYRVSGEGLRTVVVRSYSRTSRDPSYAEPALAFLGEDGCLTRVVSGYFDRRYPATDASHSGLRAEVTIHADDRYLLVMAVPEHQPAGAARPFRISRYGQMKLTLKK